jgi:hypothetical protein
LRYWKCKKFGHISSSFNKTPFLVKGSPGALSWVPIAPPSSFGHFSSANLTSMDLRRSLREGFSRNLACTEVEGCFRGSVINFPGNPQFRLRVAFKSAPTFLAMDEMKDLFSSFALRVKEDGPWGCGHVMS